MIAWTIKKHINYISLWLYFGKYAGLLLVAKINSPPSGPVEDMVFKGHLGFGGASVSFSICNFFSEVPTLGIKSEDLFDYGYN